eukprot:scaffold5289_cov107-Cylindrotheca_fusiformis.AAC.6
MKCRPWVDAIISSNKKGNRWVLRKGMYFGRGYWPSEASGHRAFGSAQRLEVMATSVGAPAIQSTPLTTNNLPKPIRILYSS